MPHSPESVLKDLKAKKFAPIYFLQGDEPYFIDLITDFIEKNAIPEHERGFNQLVIYGKESIRHYIISHTEDVSDLLEVLVLQKEAGLLRSEKFGKEVEYRPNVEQIQATLDLLGQFLKKCC